MQAGSCPWSRSAPVADPPEPEEGPPARRLPVPDALFFRGPLRLLLPSPYRARRPPAGSGHRAHPGLPVPPADRHHRASRRARRSAGGGGARRAPARRPLVPARQAGGGRPRPGDPGMPPVPALGGGPRLQARFAGGTLRVPGRRGGSGRGHGRLRDAARRADPPPGRPQGARAPDALAPGRVPGGLPDDRGLGARDADADLAGRPGDVDVERACVLVRRSAGDRGPWPRWLRQGRPGAPAARFGGPGRGSPGRDALAGGPPGRAPAGTGGDPSPGQVCAAQAPAAGPGRPRPA